ncbi:LysM peptidoglycan-binding domain-containing protein [Alicyclobacillus dauci]|uniref:LysM peptidoglycan-binding domain-containing protein n=1 Tax=Alicyclobacillus dauci TaxID=1475485 RepID=A0ABY6Z786_9BACL|nr:LysM peptidoglycan-binding domain-containing protein [Alicyclobacillus dauci]WAH38746.1 LysM peptidoglycan-binding domain-containing protein [Alicyclobacillus dauci]
MVRYMVQPGDTLWEIAAKYQTSIEAIVHANGIKNPNYIQVGQILRIPTRLFGHPKHHYDYDESPSDKYYGYKKHKHHGYPGYDD